MINNNSPQNTEYIARVNRVLDYIEIHLADSLTLDELASVSCFSPFHFHRIFRAFVGETVGQYISRLRLEKAATLLFSNPEKSITVIALNCGFSSSTTFARAFRDAFGKSASAWRKSINSEHSKKSILLSKIRQQLRKAYEVFTISSRYIYTANQQLTWRIKMNTKPKMTADVVVKKANEMTVAYVRNIGPYKNDPALFQRLITKLCTWAGPRGLLKEGKPIIAIYHDNPDITPEDKQRVSVCLEVPENTEVGGEIGKMKIPAGEYAYARFELENGQFEEAWNMVYNGWLTQSGYQPDDRPCFEVYHNDPKEHPEHKFIMDVVVAVKPA